MPRSSPINRVQLRRCAELEYLLRKRGIRKVVIGGLATDYCVKETVIDAAAKGFGVGVLAEAVRAVELEPGDGERAMEAIRRKPLSQRVQEIGFQIGIAVILMMVVFVNLNDILRVGKRWLFGGG